MDGSRRQSRLLELGEILTQFLSQQKTVPDPIDIQELSDIVAKITALKYHRDAAGELPVSHFVFDNRTHYPAVFPIIPRTHGVKSPNQELHQLVVLNNWSSERINEKMNEESSS